MYNRYIPSSDGTYHRQVVHKQTPTPIQPEQKPAAQTPVTPMPSKAEQCKLQLPHFQPDQGDLLVLLILLLMLTDGEDADPLSLLVTMAAFILLR